MKALVTGAAGFIGSRLVRRLLDDGFEVVGIDALTDYYDPAFKRRNLAFAAGHRRFTFIEADLLCDGWQHHLDGTQVVFHHAAQPGVRASWSDGFAAYTANNVLATQRLLEAVRASRDIDASLTRFIYASSSSVYGDALSFPTSEEALPLPYSPYGVTKLAAEHLCGVYARNWGLPTVSLRYFTVYGGGQRPDMALHRMILAAMGGPPFPLFGDGSQRRDFTHVDDIVDANLRAATAEVEPGGVINLAGGSDATVTDLLRLVEEAAGRAVAVERRPAAPGDVARTGGDTECAQRWLGWTPGVELAEGIAEQVAWQRSTPSVGLR